MKTPPARRRSLTGAALFFLLLSCSSCSGFAEKVCAREEAILEAVHQAADYAGPIGHVLDQGIGLILDVLCAGVTVACETTDAGARALGIIGESESPEDPGS